MKSRLGVFFALSISMGAAGAIGGCGSEPVIPNQASMTVTATPASLKADGVATSTIDIAAADATGNPGTGTVNLTITHGSLGTEGATSAQVTLSVGHGNVKVWCNAAKDAACLGVQHISATWNSVTNGTEVTFTSPIAIPDTGWAGDSGPRPAGPDASVDLDASTSGQDASKPGLDASTSALALTLSSDRTSINAKVGDHAVITAQLRHAGDAGAVMPGETITLSVDKGDLFLAPDAGAPDLQKSLDLNTDSNGTITANFTDDPAEDPGHATITAVHTASGAGRQVGIDIVGIGAMTYKGFTCSTTGDKCSLMGLAGSGWNESGTMTFNVVDTSTPPKPVVGVTVTFVFSNADHPDGTTISPSAVTDSKGNALAKLASGGTVGILTVKATTGPTDSQVVAYSDPVGVRGAKPSNLNFNFACSPVNIPVYVSNTPPAPYTVDCTVHLFDRYNNKVGTGAVVYFKTEAGGITNNIATQAFNPAPGADNTNEGSATVKFTSPGTWPAVDVDPLPADATQKPNPRLAEPSYTDGTLTRNPRDGLVTIIAYTTGEEFLKDKNGNGVWDPGETFIDQPKPFVDANDNGTYDAQDPTAPGTWADMNDKWDSDTTIWAETHILYSSRPIQGITKPADFGAVPKGSFVLFDFFFPDINLNMVAAAGTTLGISHTATKGAVSLPATSILDGYGFGMSRLLLDKATNDTCAIGTSASCYWKTQFYDWGRGGLGTATVTGAPTTDTGGDALDTVTVKATVLTVQSTATATGTIK